MEGGANSEGEARAETLSEAAAVALSKPDAIDTGIAAFLLVSGLGFLVVSSVAMGLFFRERNTFEIRARSAYLAMMNGLSLMAVLGIVVVHELPEIFLQLKVNIRATFTVVFFAVVCNTSCYGSRTIRLALLYSPEARVAAPWFVRERNHVVFCLLLAAASTAVPLYDMTPVDDDSLAEWEYLERASDHLWVVTFSSQTVVLLLNPLAWCVDDIFGVGRELRAMIVVQLVTTLTGRLAEEFAAPNLLRWINSQRMGFLGAVIMISISVIFPIQRRLMHPLQSSEPKVVKALAHRKAMGAECGAFGGASTSGVTVATDGRDGFLFSSSMSSWAQPISAGSSPGSWTYEKVMSTPETAAAFEEFSRKALCQEAFLFLEDAAIFQAQCFGGVEAEDAGDSKDNYEGVNGFNASHKMKGRRRGKVAEESQEGFMLFANIVRKYIADGAPSEVNIRSKDKNDILDVYNNNRRGDLGFCELPASERRLVFARAYAEIRFMLESNLMPKFVSTYAFDEALTAARQKKLENC